MADIPKLDASHGAGARNVEMRFTMREVLLLHAALQRRYENAAKDAWWARGRGDAGRSQRHQDQADETKELAERLFNTLTEIMETKP